MEKKDSSSPKCLLIVDDDKLLVNILCDIAERHSYDVHSAVSGPEAREVASSLKHPIDLLLTDLIMFPLSGPDLAEQLMIRYPQLKVIYMSGYTEEFIRNSTGRQDVTFLAKPILEEVLIEAIENAFKVKIS